MSEELCLSSYSFLPDAIPFEHSPLCEQSLLLHVPPPRPVLPSFHLMLIVPPRGEQPPAKTSCNAVPLSIGRPPLCVQVA